LKKTTTIEPVKAEVPKVITKPVEVKKPAKTTPKSNKVAVAKD